MKLKNARWKMKIEIMKIENEKWKMKNEKWKLKNENWKMKIENENWNLELRAQIILWMMKMIILKTVCFKKMNITTKPIEKNWWLFISETQ